MDREIMPMRHPDPWVDILHCYVTRATKRLSAGGFLIESSWLDPRDPRDATIVFRYPAARIPDSKSALVWDEVGGWRQGAFMSGQQGERTVLTDVHYLGGGILPGEDELAGRVLAETSELRREYRSVTDLRDGLDEALLARD
jgi:hypothetical protein